jgi:hypothetical protein
MTDNVKEETEQRDRLEKLPGRINASLGECVTALRILLPDGLTAHFTAPTGETDAVGYVKEAYELGHAVYLVVIGSTDTMP